MGNVMWMSFAGLGPIQQKMKGETNAGRYCQGINLAEYAYYINHVTVPVGKKMHWILLDKFWICKSGVHELSEIDSTNCGWAAGN